jgi:hypothetical protein
MKTLLYEIILITLMALAVMTVMSCGGCTQIILEKDRLKINTFFKTTEFDTAYFDPEGFFQVEKYKGVPSNIEFEYDPLTKSFKIKAKASERKLSQ